MPDSLMIPTPRAQMDGAPTAPWTANTVTTDTTGGENGAGVLWWGRVHVHPTQISLGNIISTELVDLDVFNAFKRTDVTWNTVDIFADGVTLDNPTLPTTLQELEGVAMTVTVNPEGVPSVDGTIVFTFGAVVITVFIDFQRLEACPFLPEVGVEEELEWRTMITAAKDGTESRMATRRRPRQILTYTIEVEDGPERARVENFLYLHTGDLVGVPIWHEQTRLSQAASALDTTLNVYDTQYSDYRVDGTAIVWASEADFEIVSTSVINATSIDIEAGLLGGFAADTTIVAPVRAALLVGAVRSTRDAESGLTAYQMSFRVVDNDVELASTAAFNTYLSKVLFDDFNKIDRADEEWARVVEIIDGETGLINVQQLEPNARRGSVKGFVTHTPQELWEMRQVLHALRGRQVSFWLPSFAEEFTPIANLASGTATINITNVGYTDYVNAGTARNHLRVVLNDDTTHSREILSASVISATEEQITVDSNWPSTIDIADIDRIEVLEPVRWDTDSFRITHGALAGEARMSAPVKAVLEL